MKWIVNALSVTNLSGRHVVSSQLRSLRLHAGTEVAFVVLHHAANRDLKETCGPGLIFIECPGMTRHWAGRALWERTCLRPLLLREKADALYMTSGFVFPGSPVPQAVLAMNPWCFVPDAWNGPGDRVKAALQRRAYRHAVAAADAMVYLSAYLRDTYHRNAGREARSSYVVYTPLSDDALDAIKASGERVSTRILCVSAMAPHKGVETLIEAVAQLVESGREISLTLVGGWPDSRYRNAIERLIGVKGLTTRVRITGYLGRPELLREYASARVFALFSKCESFGIPGLEAQAFGTPVVCSEAGAMPEVYGKGALTVPVGDVVASAGALSRVLGDEVIWQRLSDEARLNAGRFKESELGPSIVRVLAAVGHDRNQPALKTSAKGGI